MPIDRNGKHDCAPWMVQGTDTWTCSCGIVWLFDSSSSTWEQEAHREYRLVAEAEREARRPEAEAALAEAQRLAAEEA